MTAADVVKKGRVQVMNRETFQEAVRELGITLTATQAAQFATYYDYLIEENQKMNLTGLTAEDAVYLKHFYDSLTLVQAVPELRQQPLTLCDVGAGAGFPSLPLNIAFPQLQVTIVDSLKKRIDFLTRLTHKLDLPSVALFHARAEAFGADRTHREAFAVVTARAVAPLPVLVELCLPLVKVGGVLVAMKAQAEAETAAAAKAIALLGGAVTQELALALPESGDPRTLVVITKRKATPKRYPRRPGLPSKQPLGGE